MRAMVMEFPDDPGCAPLDRQYMLGPNLLVAPVFFGEGRVDYYLPEGRWTRLLANETVSGGGWRREEHDVFSLPLLVRPGPVIAFGGVHDRPDYDYADGVVFHVFELADETETTATIPDVEAEQALTLTSRKTRDRIVLAFSGRSDATLQVLLRGINRVRSVSRGPPGHPDYAGQWGHGGRGDAVKGSNGSVAEGTVAIAWTRRPSRGSRPPTSAPTTWRPASLPSRSIPLPGRPCMGLHARPSAP